MNVIVDIGEGFEPAGWDEERAVELATFALDEMSAPHGCEVSVSLVSPEEMHQLNLGYRGVDRPTDVLSFPCDDAWDVPENADEVLIGDIMIAPEVAAAQAPDYGNGVDEEMDLLLVHGMLHLLGFDHVEDDDAAAMQAAERRVLTAWRARRGLPPAADVLGYLDPADRGRERS